MDAQKVKKYKVAKVTWRDASHYRGPDDIEWYQENAKEAILVTVGHVLKAGRKNIIIAQEINDDGRVRDTSVIPRSVIIKIEYWEGK